jgi:hypothetical protein
MKKAIADKWVKALRSKEYKQTEGVLRSGNAFCCLGVLCNLHAQEKPKFAAKQKSPDYYGDCDSFPPPIVRNWSGLKTENGVFEDGDGFGTSLSEQNDDGRTFQEIANIIEQNWRKL